MTTPFEETAIARRYEPIRELGSGGMGTVYLVADRFRGGEQVALKTIHPERLRHLDKFRQEFTVLSKLRHPHLLRVIDFGSTPNIDVYSSIAIDSDPLDSIGGVAIGSDAGDIRFDSLATVSAGMASSLAIRGAVALRNVAISDFANVSVFGSFTRSGS